uniref:Candidate secreted effector n=1 Tax=Meloidogyne incognita TaxID=6306 RepID=A0A914LCC9_MELIC
MQSGCSSGHVVSGLAHSSMSSSHVGVTGTTIRFRAFASINITSLAIGTMTRL